jgi:16S rRNA processing protein RimM
MAPWWISKTEVDEPTIVVGLVTKPHGLRGELSVQNRSDNPDRWAAGGSVFAEDGRPFTIEWARPHGQRMLVKFEQVGDRSAAEGMRGLTLVVPESWLPVLPEGEYWPHQLLGCEVVTEAGRPLGHVSDVIENPANDLWVTTGADGEEVLVPALTDVIVSVDLGGRRVVVREIPGLTGPESEAVPDGATGLRSSPDRPPSSARTDGRRA